jgi:murein DD-endopeptidase MepM/ murein hydrolase activator NlpD
MFYKAKKGKIKLLFLILASFMLVLTPTFFILGENGDNLNSELDNKKEEIKDLDERISNLESEIENKKAEAVNLENQLSILDNEISKTETKIERTKKEIEKVNLEIKKIQNDIKEKEAEMARQKVILSGLIREMYQNDRVSFLEIIFSYKTFSDFLDQSKYLESVEKESKLILDEIKKIKEELEWQHQVLNNRKQSLTDLKVDLDDSKKVLDEEKNGKENLLMETEEQEEKFQELLQQAREEQEAANNEISRLQSEIERKIRESQNTEDNWESLGSAGELDWPVYPTRGISAYFMDPSYYQAFGINHYAVDIPGQQGSAIHAPADGYMIRYRDAGMGYSYIVLYHGEGMTTVYGHVTGCTLAEGQHIKRGDVVGYSGGAPGTKGAGWLTTGPHLHFEVRINGNPVNPMSYLVSI